MCVSIDKAIRDTHIGINRYITKFKSTLQIKYTVLKNKKTLF